MKAAPVEPERRTLNPAQQIRWPRRLSWRLALGFGTLVGLMLLVLALVILQIRAMTVLTERFATDDMQRLLRVQSLALTTEGVGNALLHLMNAPREQRVPVYADVDERNRRIDGIIQSLSNNLDELTQVQTLRRLNEARAAYSEAFIATVDEIEGEDPKAALAVYRAQVMPALQQVLTESNVLINRERERIEQQMAGAQARFEQLAFWAVGLSLLAVGLGLALAMGTTRSVALPLKQLKAAAQRIAGGDYQHPVVATGTDEIDQVGQALTAMTGAIAAREHEIERLAFSDRLTSLPNRTFLLQADMGMPLSAGAGDSLSMAGADGDRKTERLDCLCRSLLLFDLARLKTINETLGFATGDTLIKEVASRAQAVLKAVSQSQAAGLTDFQGSKTLLTHINGGRFAIVSELNERAAVEHLQRLLTEAMVQPVQCGDHSVDLSLAFGLADSTADAALPVITLLRNAEVALNAAKRAAHAFAWYNPAQEAARLSHLGLLSDLRMAVAQSQLQMWLQPKFSLQTAAPVGAEALVRWQHPTRGFVSPAEFVPFAEQTGAITLVTDWMLDKAMQTLQQWQQRQPQLSISVNVSTRDLQDSTFCQRVRERMTHYGIAPHRLRLEIVESGLMQDAYTSIALLHCLRDAGVELSIDDFGTGYSSLAYLQQLPVSELKIDRSFVTDIDSKPGSLQLVKTMIEMGHGMGLLVTAEGIETQAERDTLKALNCDVMQGYFGSRPLFGDKLQAWFDQLPTESIAA
ncbi:MAG: GGDEF domain-containing protein [Rhodoferax sp.]|uniref:putative bifunctional diguanylate cyclase/phosphodiesterase n=1 Tax=Rhodoferax sp. TaxID=50421 RepID=UPI001B530ECA|nr:EAL domain-containing protein [Rhodoferax sp.]MBP9907310.1 GGDEF domain-containing protein [Rhodoferax sp.]